MEFRRVSEDVGFQMPLTDYRHGWVASPANSGLRAVSATLNSAKAWPVLQAISSSSPLGAMPIANPRWVVPVAYLHS